MFKQTSGVFLALSIALSVKSMYFVTLKCISILKPFLGFTTKLVLMLWIIFSVSPRLMAMVLYFTPALGLFSILGHWKLEQVPYSDSLNFNNRYNYTARTAPHYKVYTYFSLSEYFYGFLILLVLHICLNALAKTLCSEDFRRNLNSSLLFKLIHCVENTNIPTVWMDWEEKKGSIEDHKRRHGQVMKEMVVIMVIRTIFNAVMMSPVIYTGKNNWTIFQVKTFNSSNQSVGAP